jgi:hypothetical protein
MGAQIGHYGRVRDWLGYEREHGYVRVRMRLVPTEEGGRARAIFSEYRASWDIGNTVNGEWCLNDAPLVFEDVGSVAPGREAIARIHPVAPEFWRHVDLGSTIHAHEGRRRVGTATVLEVVRPDD